MESVVVNSWKGQNVFGFPKTAFQYMCLEFSSFSLSFFFFSVVSSVREYLCREFEKKLNKNIPEHGKILHVS